VRENTNENAADSACRMLHSAKTNQKSFVMTLHESRLTESSGVDRKDLDFFSCFSAIPFSIPNFPSPVSHMTTLRRFRATDLFRLNAVNLDHLTENYTIAYYFQYLSLWVNRNIRIHHIHRRSEKHRGKRKLKEMRMENKKK